MEKHYQAVAVLLIIILGVAGGFFTLLYSDNSQFQEKTPIAKTVVPSRNRLQEVSFQPPPIESAPDNIREGVQKGYEIMMNTPAKAGSYVGNSLSCRNCHFQGGKAKDGFTLVGVAATQPVTPFGSSESLVQKISRCFETSLNGKAPPPNSGIMYSLLTYFQWISKGVPLYAQVPWLGEKQAPSQQQPDSASGMKIFTSQCSTCHGPQGEGTNTAPAVMGGNSWSNASPMADISNLSYFVYHYMPYRKSNLAPDQAMDVSGFLLTSPRPGFHRGTGPGRQGGY
jgi:thiosulfate dehydrogenase